MLLLLACMRPPPPDAMAVQAAEIAAMQARLSALEARVATIENEGVSTVPPDPQTERLASERLGVATTLLGEAKSEEAREIIRDILASYPGTRAAKAAVRYADELEIVGEPAPALQVEYWFGAEGAYGSRLTLVVFGEAWCPHCQREAPKLQELYAQLRGEGLEVLLLTRLTRSSTAEEVTAFIVENGLTYPVGKEMGDAMTRAYRVTGIPAAALVRDGVVVWRGHPARLDLATLRRFLE